MTQTTENKRFRVEVGYFQAGERDREYVLQALGNNRLSYGPFMQRFERDMAALHERKHGVMCNSGTSALQAALSALKEADGWRDGDGVIVPAVTFVASSNVVLQSNLKPVFVDVDKQTYNINADLIENAITPRTRAIMPVHLFGMPCDMDAVMRIARKHGLRVIEDSCETMFARYKGRPAGSFGDISCFSTYIAHLIVTGVGGLAMTDDDGLAIAMRSLINHGRDAIYIKPEDSDKPTEQERRLVMERRFNFIRVGYSYRATELEAAIGCAQLEHWKEIIGKRQENARYLISKLSPLSERIQLPFVPGDREHVFMMLPVVIKDATKREELTHFLEENGVETRLMMPLLNQPVYKKLFGADFEQKFPVTKWIDEKGFYICTHQGLAKEDLDYVAAKFEDYFKKK